jgi:eukaryotic-like serine/threonine-protein kinase
LFGLKSIDVSLAPGSKLGPYEILASIGAGGMCEGCKARDTPLNRIVAVKRWEGD